MERLTKWNGSSNQHAYYPRCFEEPCNGGGCKIKDCPFETAVCERLAVFEDIAELIGGVARLRELAEADKDGRCVVLPCKVGDKLYRVFAGEIFEHRVGSMKYFAIQGRWDIETYPFCPCVESSIGKTVFLSHKEAERAMQEMEGRKDG